MSAHKIFWICLLGQSMSQRIWFQARYMVIQNHTQFHYNRKKLQLLSIKILLPQYIWSIFSPVDAKYLYLSRIYYIWCEISLAQQIVTYIWPSRCEIYLAEKMWNNFGQHFYPSKGCTSYLDRQFFLTLFKWGRGGGQPILKQIQISWWHLT